MGFGARFRVWGLGEGCPVGKAWHRSLTESLSPDSNSEVRRNEHARSYRH